MALLAIIRKKNEKTRGGKVYFYEPKKIVDGKPYKMFDERIELMKLYNTEHLDLGFSIEENDSHDIVEERFRDFYVKAIEDIDNKMNGR